MGGAITSPHLTTEIFICGLVILSTQLNKQSLSTEIEFQCHDSLYTTEQAEDTPLL